MKKNKNKKLLIIIIVLVLLILIVGTVFAFVATNLFKSDKDMFFKYASQLLDNEKGILDNKIVQYNQKKSNSKYEFLGSFKADIESDSLDKNTLNNIQNFEISFAGNIDNILDQQEALFKINYSDNVNFPIQYKKSNGLVGIKINDIIKKYLTVKENELPSLLNKIGVNMPISLELIDLSAIKMVSQNIDNVKDKYIQVIKENLEDSRFSKVKGMNSEGYCLEISNQKILDLVIKILENLKNDETTLTKIDDYFGIEYDEDDIDGLIQIISDIQVSEGNSRITIYQKDDKLNKIEIQFNDLVNITITKNSTDNDVNYNIYAETKDYSISFDAKYTGLNTLQSVNESYSLNLTVGDSYTYNIKNTVNFTDEIEINDFEENEYSDLNKMNKEQLTKLFEALTNAIDKVNKEKLEKANIQGQNPLLNILPDFSKVFTTNYTSGQSQLNIDTKQEDNNSSEKTGNEEKVNTESNIVENMEKVEKETFNARFTQYEGKNVRGATVKSLIMQIIATNMADEEKQIKVTGDIVLTGDEVPASIETSKTYTVECSTGIDGYINSVEIIENK